MTLKKNIIANYLGTGVIVLSPILALPWYLAALGPKQFGLIGFVVMLQAVLGLLDAGMSQALVREFSIRFFAVDGRQRAAALLFGFERIYWAFAWCAASVALLLSGSIASHWINLDGLPESSGHIAIYGAACIFAVQFPGSIYRSLLVGAQAQVALNGVMLTGAVMRQVGGVVVVTVWPTLANYLVWHASMAMLETLARGRLAWHILGIRRKCVQWDLIELQPVWRTAASMSGATLLGALTVQMDRIVLSRIVTMEQFGYYTIAANVAVGLLQLVGPLIQAALPRAIQLRARPKDLHKLNTRLIWLITAIVLMGTFIFTVSGRWLLTIWLGNPQAVDVIYSLLAVLLIGTAMNAFYNVGYMNWIVHEKVRRVFQVNVLSLTLSIIFIPVLVSSLGLVGAAYGWLIINFFGFVFGLEWVKNK